MTLRTRLVKLEAKNAPTLEGPRVIMFNACWRDDDDNLQSIGQFAKVLTGAGWETITRATDEPDAEFRLRAETMAGDAQAGSAWAMAALRRKHAPLDPA
ncbi:hypothetical protein [Pseudorhodobacter sp. MZDSW-24AT]|uniref:hypothetical protein n=1 Tax=Pseudorhodobacter sp. MZDSW-24AT TaxID=2052957 RepID=UPI000C1E5747|nr:hypothetical protein [Pseudorhodobacter sp. MZDSW-24AT]PJF08392.1 hypothetical protein CUR21_15120 [Pseudorhodobacter sp. MZDSW-24AT]